MVENVSFWRDTYRMSYREKRSNKCSFDYNNIPILDSGTQFDLFAKFSYHSIQCVLIIILNLHVISWHG